MAIDPSARSSVSMTKFLGRISNADPRDIPPGAMQAQVNLQCLSAGKLTCRKGVQKSSVYTPSSPGSSNIIALYTYQRPDGDYVITVDAAGTMKARRGSAARTLASSLNTFAQWHFFKARNGDLIAVNGIERGLRWDGITSAAEQLGITAPAAAPAATTPVGGAATAGDYTLAFRYIDNTLPTAIPSSLSPTVTVTAAANDQFNWSGLTAPTEARVSIKELWRSTVGYPNVLYFIAQVVNGTTTYTTDTSSDATLTAAALADSTKKLLVLSPNGDLNGRRFNPPPTFTRAAVQFQDRAFYAAHVKYTTGTITTNGTTTLTGSGTSWNSSMVGRYIYTDGEVIPLVVSAFVSATELTLTAAAATSASGLSYAMLPSPEERNQIYFSEVDEPESVPTTNVSAIQENTGDDDEITGLMPFGAVLYVLKERHIYAYTFVRQPKIDADSRLLAHRGCLNQRCWDFHEGVAYLMDQSGCYAMSTGGSIKPISDPIQDMFRDTTIDWTNSRWFYVTVDPVYQLVRFHVGFTADSSTRPKKALVYNIRTEQWWVESYHEEMGGSGRITSSGTLGVVMGGQSDVVYLMNQGTADYVTSSTSGTLTSATSTVLTDSTAAFSGLAGAPVAIYAGTGKNQITRIISHTPTALTVSPALSTVPDNTSKYLVGAIEYNCKTSMFDLSPIELENERSVEVSFTPTTAQNYFDMRRFFNGASSPENNVLTSGLPDGPTPLVQRTKDDPDDVVNMKVARSTRGNSAGVAKGTFSGKSYDRFESKRDLEIQLRGYQGSEAIEFLDVMINGVGGE